MPDLGTVSRFSNLLEAGDEGWAVPYEIGEPIAVEMGQEGLDRPVERRLERAQSVDRASAPRGKATGEAFEVLETANHVAHDDLGGRPGKTHSATASAEGHHQPFGLQALRHLGEMIARDAVPPGDVVDR